MALIDDFKAQFPEFDTATVDSVWDQLQAQWPCLYGGAYGVNSCTDTAILYLNAHLFAVSQQSNSAAPSKSVNSRSVGAVSISFSEGKDGLTRRESFFNSTKYGQAFLNITQFRQGAFFV